MPAPLPIDIRENIIRAYRSGKSVKEIAAWHYVGRDAVYKLIRRVNETGSVHPKPLNNGRKPKITADQLEQVKQRVLTEPTVTLAKLIKELGLPVGASALSRIINHKLNLRKK